MTVPKTNLFGERGEFDAVHVIVELLSPLHRRRKRRAKKKKKKSRAKKEEEKRRAGQPNKKTGCLKDEHLFAVVAKTVKTGLPEKYKIRNMICKI